MAKLADLLKEKGWTDEQIGKAFADAVTLTALDDLFGTVTSERDALKARDAEWQRNLDEKYNPAIAAAERKAMEAERRASMMEKDIQLAKEYGYYPEESDTDKKLREAAEAAAARGGQSVDLTKYVSHEDAAKMLRGESIAIVTAGDIIERHRSLTGNSIIDYETTIDGRYMSGLSALREEAERARKPMDQYIAEKFKYEDLKRQRAEARQKEHDDRISKEAEEKVRREYAEKFGNPLLAQPSVSRRPEIPLKRTDGKHAWDFTATERKSARLQRAMDNQMKSTVQ